MQQRVAEKTADSPEKRFKTVVLNWHGSNKAWSENHAARLLASMNNHLFPAIGNMLVTELKTQHFTSFLKGIEAKKLLEVASRSRQYLCNIMRYAVQQGLVEHNTALNLEGVTAPPVKRHYPALALEHLPELLARINDYTKERQLTRLGVMLTLHLFIRSSELRFARWGSLISRTRHGPFPLPEKPLPTWATQGAERKCAPRTSFPFPNKR